MRADLGATYAWFPVSGISPTTASVTITASATGWASGTLTVDVETPTFYFWSGVPTSRTTLSAPHSLSVSTYLPSCGFCRDEANTDITVHFTVAGSPPNIVTLDRTSVALGKSVD